MVPPQVVVDAMIGGMRPQPSHVPTREEYAATGNWIGNDALWISLPTDGTLLVRQESPTRAQHPAEPWGTKVWMIPLKSGQPTLTGRRLGGGRTGHRRRDRTAARTQAVRHDLHRLAGRERDAREGDEGRRKGRLSGDEGRTDDNDRAVQRSRWERHRPHRRQVGRAAR